MGGVVRLVPGAGALAAVRRAAACAYRLPPHPGFSALPQLISMGILALVVARAVNVFT